MNYTHKQIEATPGPVIVEITNKAGERFCQWTYFQQKRNFNKQNNQALDDTNDGEDYDKIEVEDVGDTKGNTQEDGKDRDPLTIERKVFFLKVQRESFENIGCNCQQVKSHFVWRYDGITGNKNVVYT